MTKRMALDVEKMSPFGRVIYDYLLSFRPNKLVADLAHETSINNQTIWDWLRKGTVPRRSTIEQIAQTTTLPLDELLAAAGLPLHPGKLKRSGPTPADMEKAMGVISQWMHTRIGGYTAREFDDYLEDRLHEVAGDETTLPRGVDTPPEEPEASASRRERAARD